MILISISDFLFLLILSILLIILYQSIVRRKRWKIIQIVKEKYLGFDRNNRKENYVRNISIRPIDRQKIIFEDICILIIVFSIMFLLITKSIFFAVVVSGSMRPTFDKNDIVLMQNINRDYKIGDIIIFESPDTALPVTHRIVKSTNEGFQTAGDNTGRTDWWIIKNRDILGKAILIGDKPLVINNVGRYFIIENRDQRFGPFDYRTYFLFFDTLRLYGYAIAIMCILLYIALEIRRIKATR